MLLGKEIFSILQSSYCIELCVTIPVACWFFKRSLCCVSKGNLRSKLTAKSTSLIRKKIPRATSSAILGKSCQEPRQTNLNGEQEILNDEPAWPLLKILSGGFPSLIVFRSGLEGTRKIKTWKMSYLAYCKMKWGESLQPGHTGGHSNNEMLTLASNSVQYCHWFKLCEKAMIWMQYQRSCVFHDGLMRV